MKTYAVLAISLLSLGCFADEIPVGSSQLAVPVIALLIREEIQKDLTNTRNDNSPSWEQLAEIDSMLKNVSFRANDFGSSNF